MDIIAEIRKNKPAQVRRDKKIPAVLYGRGIENSLLEVDYATFEKAYREAGESSILNLKIGNDARNVLIYDVQKDPVTGKYSHIDFYQVRMDEKITVSVPLVFIGESPAVKELAGILVRNFHEIEVEALPNDLPHEIKVDISAIKTFEDHIYVKDLPVPASAEILAGAEEIVASVIAPRSEEELAGLEEKPTAPVEVGEIKTEAEEKRAAEEAEKEEEEKK